MSQHYTVIRVGNNAKGKGKAPSEAPGGSGNARPPTATLQPRKEKKPRRKSALDMYQISDECDGRGDGTLGQWRHQNCLDWMNLSDTDRRRFTSQADEFNAALRAAQELEAPEEDSPPV